MDDPNTQTVIKISDDRQKKKDAPVPPIAIERNRSAISVPGRAMSIKDIKDKINETRNTHRTARGTPPSDGNNPIRKRKFVIDNDDAEDVPTNTVPVPIGRVPASILTASLTNDVINQKSLPEDEVWNLIKACNRIVYDFGKKHNVALDELLVYAECITNHKYDPQVFAEFFHPGQSNLGHVHKQYAEIEKKDPEKYKLLVLELFKIIVEGEAVGETPRSMMVDTHTALQNDQIAAQVSTIRQQYIGMGVAGLTSLVGWVLSILQFIDPSAIHSNCNSTS